MAAAVWKGAISFGLVNVPVSLHSAVRPKTVRFHQLHEEDGGRVELRRVCSVDGKELPWNEVAKGYEIARGEHVIIDDNELSALEAKANQSIEIEDFVPLGQVDPVLFDRSYILVPDRAVVRPYQLLRDAMLEEDKVGIARIVLRTKEHLCVIRATAQALVLSTLHYSDELVEPDSLGAMAQDQEVPKRELEMAGKLIEAMSAEFDPTKYHDRFREAVMELVATKAQGEYAPVTPPEKKAAPIIDLAAALEASLATSGTTSRPKSKTRSSSKATNKSASAARNKAS